MKLTKLSLQRRWIRRRPVESPLREFLDTPLPDGRSDFNSTEFVCLDIETTGLDANTADMLAVGWVLIRNGRVNLSSCESYLVRPEGEVGESAAVHGLTDTQVSAGLNQQRVFRRVIEVLAGRTLVVHHAGLDMAMLDRLCRQQFGCKLPVPVIDTLAMEQKRQRRHHHLSDNKSLRLADLRAGYNLPYYQAHDCLVDAISTAELLIAMIASHDGAKKTQLRQLLEQS